MNGSYTSFIIASLDGLGPKSVGGPLENLREYVIYSIFAAPTSGLFNSKNSFWTLKLLVSDSF